MCYVCHISVFRLCTQVDVVVNSSNPLLNLKMGRLSTEIMQAAGSKIQDECEKNYPAGIGFGQLAVTSGGNMRCKALFHGTIGSWDHGHGYAETVSCFLNVVIQCSILYLLVYSEV